MTNNKYKNIFKKTKKSPFGDHYNNNWLKHGSSVYAKTSKLKFDMKQNINIFLKYFTKRYLLITEEIIVTLQWENQVVSP